MRLILYVLILCLTMWAGFFLYHNSGHLELSYGDWVVDMPIWLPVLGSIIILFGLTIILTVFSSVGRTYRKFREWITGSSMRAVTDNANEALSALAEGDWAHAETRMLKAAKNSDTPLHYYLAAAQAAQYLGAIDRRDIYLHQALQSSPTAKLTVGLTQAELQFQQGQYEYCLATLNEVQKLAVNNKLLLKLYADVYSTTGAWEEIINLLPALSKYAVMPLEDFTALQIKAYTYVLRTEAKKTGKQGLITLWDSLPREVRNQDEIVEHYVQLLLTLNAPNEVEAILRNHLKRQWDPRLVKLYGLTLSSDVGKQITNGEAWLKSHEDDPKLLLALARLCIANKLWGKARNYLDASLAIESTPDAYAELGRLLSFLGDQQRALECYKKGLFEVADVLPIEQQGTK